MPATFDDLTALRERHFGFALDFVARRTGIDAARLVAIEAGAAPNVYEIEQLATTYGIDEPDDLIDSPIRLSPADSMTVLAQHAEFRDVASDTRAHILAAGQAARDIVVLRGILGDELPTTRHAGPASAPRETAFQQGARRAQWLRTKLALGSDPILSMRDLVTDSFPEITLLYAHLGSDGVAGLAFGDRVRGPSIVLNLDGKNANALVRRFSLAHELAHLLFDWNRAEPFGQLSGFKDDRQLRVEQAANAFALRLLCPEARARRVAKHSEPMLAVTELSREWGIHFDAGRLYLKNVANIDVPRDPSQALLAAQTRGDWARAEDPELDRFPISQTPPERRTVVARLAASAYAKDLISRDRFARLLGVTPAAALESVLDLYSLDPPQAA